MFKRKKDLLVSLSIFVIVMCWAVITPSETVFKSSNGSGIVVESSIPTKYTAPKLDKDVTIMPVVYTEVFPHVYKPYTTLDVPVTIVHDNREDFVTAGDKIVLYSKDASGFYLVAGGETYNTPVRMAFTIKSLVAGLFLGLIAFGAATLYYCSAVWCPSEKHKNG